MDDEGSPHRGRRQLQHETTVYSFTQSTEHTLVSVAVIAVIDGVSTWLYTPLYLLPLVGVSWVGCEG